MHRRAVLVGRSLARGLRAADAELRHGLLIELTGHLQALRLLEALQRLLGLWAELAIGIAGLESFLVEGLLGLANLVAAQVRLRLLVRLHRLRLLRRLWRVGFCIVLLRRSRQRDRERQGQRAYSGKSECLHSKLLMGFEGLLGSTRDRGRQFARRAAMSRAHVARAPVRERCAISP